MLGLAGLMPQNRQRLLADSPRSPNLNPLAPKVTRFAFGAK